MSVEIGIILGLMIANGIISAALIANDRQLRAARSEIQDQTQSIAVLLDTIALAIQENETLRNRPIRPPHIHRSTIYRN